MRYACFVVSYCLLCLFFSCNKSFSPAPDEKLAPFDLGKGIWGYTDKMSYSPGDSIHIFLGSDTLLLNQNIPFSDINGNIIFSVKTDVKKQGIQNEKPWQNGFGLIENYALLVPANLKSGIYLINQQIPVVIKSASKKADITIVYPSNTANAYSNMGGKSFYEPASPDLRYIAHELSFQRPQTLDFFSQYFLAWFCTLPGYSVQYIADIDLDDYSAFAGSRLLIIPGHSEYWTRKARTNFDHFVNTGHNALVLSGNTMWWQIRYSDDKTKEICYKDINLDKDTVSDKSLTTTLWNKPLLKYPIINSIGGSYDYAGEVDLSIKSGETNVSSAFHGYKIVQPSSPLLEGTGLKKGSVIHFDTHEYDGISLQWNKASSSIQYNRSLLPNTRQYKYEVIGYDSLSAPASNGNFSAAVLLVYQPNPQSGTIVNSCTTNWCAYNGMGYQDGDKIKKITINAIEKSLAGKSLF